LREVGPKGGKNWHKLEFQTQQFLTESGLPIGEEGGIQEQMLEFHDQHFGTVDGIIGSIEGVIQEQVDLSQDQQDFEGSNEVVGPAGGSKAHRSPFHTQHSFPASGWLVVVNGELQEQVAAFHIQQDNTPVGLAGSTVGATHEQVF